MSSTAGDRFAGRCLAAPRASTDRASRARVHRRAHRRVARVDARRSNARPSSSSRCVDRSTPALTRRGKLLGFHRIKSVLNTLHSIVRDTRIVVCNKKTRRPIAHRGIARRSTPPDALASTTTNDARARGSCAARRSRDARADAMSLRPGSKASERKKGFKKAIDADEARRKREGACSIARARAWRS